MAKQNQSPSDNEIIKMYWARNEDAILETDKKYGKYAYKIAFNILQDHEDCEECKNDAYIAIWNAIPPTKPEVFRSFVAQIIRRIAINRYREKNAAKRVPSELFVSIEELHNYICDSDYWKTSIDSNRLGEYISNYLLEISDRQRYIFIERFYFAEPVAQIAADLSVAQSTIYREVERIKSGLKKYLEKRGVY